MRSLPERFRAKVIAIEEVKHVLIMKLDELIGSLKVYDKRVTVQVMLLILEIVNDDELVLTAININRLM